MKNLLLMIAIAIAPQMLSAQCDAPAIESWHFASPMELEVVFEGSVSMDSYELKITGLYSDVMLTNLTAVFEGEVQEGTNAIIANTAVALPALTAPETYFYEAQFRVSCGGEWSSVYQFYVSPHSMRNDPDFICDLPFTTIQYLADGAGFLYNVPFLIPPGDVVQEITDLGILVDVGHNYNGDLAISLISPQGTEVSLLNFPNSFGGSTGLSLYFWDDAIPDPTGPSTTQGIVQPASPLAALAGEPSHGLWTLQIVDNLAADFGYTFGGCINMNTTPCVNSIAGSAWYDLNSNSVNDENEPPLSFGTIENLTSQETFFINSNGSYLRCFGEGDVELGLASQPPYFLSQPESHAYTLGQNEEIVGADFALVPDGEQKDLRADIYSFGPDRPGFSNTYYVVCENVGNICQDNVELSISLDQRLTVNMVNAPDFTLNENMVTIPAGTLCPFESATFTINHTLSDTVSIGSMLSSTGVATPIDGDAFASNNTYTYEPIVVGSYDPNDKQVSQSEIAPQFLQEGKYLDYHIRFQNTGTYYAERVVVADTIDTDLDLSTLEVLAYSHPMEISADGNVLYFTFDEIFLPDSTTNEPESHGFIRYRIKPVSTFAEGETIDNTAYIYFDFNEAIITNTVTTVLNVSLSVENIAHKARIYPNPASDILSVQLPAKIQPERLIVYDLSGRVVQVHRSAMGNDGSLAIPIDELSQGAYILMFESSERIRPVRFVKL